MLVMLALPAQAGVWEGWVDDVYIEVTTSLTAQVIRPASWEGHGTSVVRIPEYVRIIDDLDVYEVPVTIIKDDAFRDRHLMSVTLCRNLKIIEPNAFAGCTGIYEVKFNCENMDQMERSMFPHPVSVFYDSRETLRLLTIGPHVQKIPAHAFDQLDHLSMVTIPSSVEYIYAYAFEGCSNLVLLDMESATPPSLGFGAFDDQTVMYLHVPEGATQNYANNNDWRSFNIYEGNDYPVAVTYQGTELYYRLDSESRTATVVCPYFDGGWFRLLVKPHGAVVIPDYITDYQGHRYDVTGVDVRALGDCPDLTSVTIGRNITFIHHDAFWDSQHINTVYYNAIQCEDMPLRTSAFYPSEGALEHLVIGNEVTQIPAYAFYNCNHIGEIAFPPSLNKIGVEAFKGCSSLEGAFSFPNGFVMGEEAFMNCSQLAEVDIAMASVPNGAFCGCSSLSSLTLGNTVTAIGARAFSGCISLTSLELPNSLRTIGAGAFDGCSGLSGDLVLPPYVQEIGACAFRNCPQVTSVNFPSLLTSIGDNAFKNCTGLPGDLVLPNTLQTIGEGAFEGCTGFSSVSVNVPVLNANTFKSCTGLTEVTIGQNVTEIACNTFENCNQIATVNFNATNCNRIRFFNSFYSYERYSPFRDSRETLTTLNIAAGVTCIPGPAFYQCYHLSGLNLPASVRTIEADAFAYCSDLTGALDLPILNTLGSGAFKGCTGLTSVSVDVPTISEEAFKGCTGLTEVTIGQSVTEVKKKVFEDCNHIATVNFNALNCTNMGSAHNSAGTSPFDSSHEVLSRLNIGSGVTRIPAYAFYHCIGLLKPDFPASLKIIDQNAFARCNSIIGSLELTGLEQLRFDAFYKCIALTSVSVDVPTISENVFMDCTDLTEVTIGQHVKEIKKDAFKGCANITTVNFNATNCTKMDSDHRSAFNGENFATLNIGSGVVRLPNYAFKGCSSLNTINVSATTPPVLFDNSFNYSTHTLLRVPQESYGLYRGHEYWGRFMLGSDLVIAGVEVTEDNAANITGAGITSGTVSYSFETHTLTLNGAIITIPNALSLESWVDNLHIKLIGNNSITTTNERPYYWYDEDAILLHGATVLEGTGTLAVSAAKRAIYMTNSLALEGGCLLNITSDSGYPCIQGVNGTTLTIDGSQLSTPDCNHNNGTMIGFDDVVMVNCVISEPEGAVYDPVDRCFKDAEQNMVKGRIVIDNPAYDLWVAGTRVTESNWDDVLGDGTVSYYKWTHTLILHDADLSVSHGEALRSELDDLVVNLAGSNTMTSSSGTALVSTGDLRFVSSGASLTVEGYLHGIRTNGDLTIDPGCDITVRSYGPGEYGAVVGDPNKTLAINTARLYAEAPYSNRSAIAGFDDVEMDFSIERFDQPSFPIMWNATDHCYEYMEGNQTLRYRGVIDIVCSDIGVTVAGVPVTLDNAADVLGNGKVSFDPVYKRLTLNDASVAGGSSYGIESHLRDLRIALVGINSVSSSVTEAIYADQPFSIEGTGRLNISQGDGIHADGCDLTIGGGCTVVVGGTHTCIYGDADHTLTIGPSTVSASIGSQQITPIAGFGNLVLDETRFIYPAGGSYADGQVNDANGDAYYDVVRIAPVLYDLSVRNVYVTSVTAADILGDGTMSYDPRNKVLTLDGTTLDAGSETGISSQIEGLKIVVIGDNDIQSSGHGIYSNRDFTIEGNGTLIVQGYCGIVANSCNLTIGDGCTVVAESTRAGNNAGIHGSSNKTLTLRRCQVTAKVAASNNLTAIYGFGTLNLEGTRMSQPSGGSYRNYQVYNYSNNLYYGDVIITPTPYELWVNGEQVDPVNARDVLGDGTVSYDAVSNELTLNGADLYTQGDPGIENWIEGLKIVLVGNNNHIEADTGIHSEADFTIGGSGSVTIVGDAGINAKDCDLTITDGCTIDVEGRGNESYYTALHGNTGHTLTVDRSTLIAKSSITSPSYSAIYGFDALNMVGVTMDDPNGGIYQSDGVMVGGYPYYGEVVIAPMAYPLWIAGVQVTSANADNFTDYVERGSVHYDADAYELYLDNATLRYGESGAPVIYSNALTGLSIYLTGDNYLVGSESEGCIALELQSTGDDNQVNIFGPGTLTTNADMKLGGIWYVYLDDCSLNIGGGGSLYTMGGTVNGFDLELSQSLLTASSVYGMGYYGGNIDGAYIMQPEGAYVDQSGGIFVNGELAHEVAIGCEYDLWVADVQVTSLNASHISGEGIEGHVSYDASNKVLTLDHATITPTNSEGIYNSASVSTNFTINLVGDNTIISQDNDGIYTSPATTITGTGDLVVSGTRGISCRSHLSLEGGTIEAIGMHHAALLGMNDKTLTVAAPATLRAYVNGAQFESSIAGFAQLVMTGEEVLQPLGGHYNATLRRFEDAEGESYSDFVEISNVAYDLWLGSTRVTSDNASDLSNAPGVTAGAVSYDKITRTLTLNGATLNFATDPDGITSHINGLNIQLVGNNTLVAGANGIVIGQANTTIKGNGSLGITLTGEGVGIKATDMEGRLLTIEDAGCTVSIDASDNIGLVTDGMLRVNKATLNITSNTATLRADDVMLDYVSINTPADAWFDAENHRVNDVDGNELIGQLSIGPTQYELYVVGTQVTGLNVNDVLGDGAISYDAMENTLTLTEATIVSPQDGYYSGIITGVENLSITLVGENKIYTNDYGIEIQNVNTTITGTGKLQIYSTGDKCIVANGGMANKTLTISGGCTVIMEESPEGGIYLDEGNLAVDRSTLEIKSEDEGMMLLYANALDMCGTTYISIPEGGYFDGDVIMNSDGTVSGSHAKIEPVKYQLYVAGTQVDAINATDVFGDGTVRYDEVGKTLTLTEAYIHNDAEEYGIMSYIDDLDIVLEGVNYISAYEEGLSLYADAAISGPGRLEIYSGGYGVYGNDAASLTLKDGCSVYGEASSGIYLDDGQSGMGSVLTVENSTLEIDTYDGETPAVSCLDLNLRHTGIAVPTGASFENNTIVDAEHVPASHVEIGPAYYDLYVAGTQVTALNANDVLGDGGTVRYDIDNTTLILDGASLNYQETTYDGCIDNGIDNLKIALVGMNDIVSSKPGIYSDADGTTINGNGTLTVRSQEDGIFLNGSGLTLEGGCQVDVASTGSGNFAAIYCDSPKVLRIDWSTLRASSPSTRCSAVNGFAELVLEGTEIITPQNGYYSGGEIYNGNHQKHYGLAVIEPCNVFTGTADDDWNNEANWSKNQLPDAFNKVYVDSYCVMNADVDVRAIVVNADNTLEVESNVILTTQTISTASVDDFVINDGAQVFCNSANTLATMHKYIGRTNGDNFGWYLIAAPMDDPTIEGLDVNIYDIYAYDEDADQNEWKNYRVSSFGFEPGQGYLYANNANMEMLMSGALVPSDAVLTIDLSYGAISDDIRGYNLVGNPYPRNLSLSEMKIDGQPVTEYYRLVQTVDGTTYELCTEGDILPGEAFFIKATAVGQRLTIGGN